MVPTVQRNGYEDSIITSAFLLSRKLELELNSFVAGAIVGLVIGILFGILLEANLLLV